LVVLLESTPITFFGIASIFLYILWFAATVIE
jgi:hypothetical protein